MTAAANRQATVLLGLVALVGCTRSEPAASTPAAPPTQPEAPGAASSLPMLHGRVVAEDGKPVISFKLDGEDVADPEGRFHLKAGHGGKRTLVIFAPGFASTALSLDVSPEMDTNIGDIVLERGRLIQGHLSDLVSGRPVPGAMVDVSNTPVSGQHQTTLDDALGAARTDEHGDFCLRAENSPTLVIDHPHYVQTWLPLQKGDLKLSLLVDPGGRLKGKVTSSAPDVLVRVVRDDGVVSRDALVEDGEYEVEGLPDGLYFVTLWPAWGPALHPLDTARRVRLPGKGTVTLNF